MKYYATPHRFLRHMPTLPFHIPGGAPDDLIMDFWVELYHRVCFPFYRIAYVKRREYIKIDRHKLNVPQHNAEDQLRLLRLRQRGR